MAKRDHEGDVPRFIAGERVHPVLRSIPDNVDPALVATAVMKMFTHHVGWFAGKCRHLPAPVIREVLDRLTTGWVHVFLRLAVPSYAEPVALVAHWQRALQALRDLDLTYAWGSAKRRARFVALASDPQILEAIQGAAANCDNVSLDVLAVLVADGSDASFDALVRHVDPAFVHKDLRLDRLTRLRTHAKATPALTSLLAELDGAVAERNAISPALALGPVIGVGALEPFWFDASIRARESSGGNVPRVQVAVHVDSRAPTWFRVYVVAVHYLDNKSTSFTDSEIYRDDLALGRCDPQGVPAFLTATAKRLRVTWDEPRVRSHLRGVKRARIAAWLTD